MGIQDSNKGDLSLSTDWMPTILKSVVLKWDDWSYNRIEYQQYSPPRVICSFCSVSHPLFTEELSIGIKMAKAFCVRNFHRSGSRIHFIDSHLLCPREPGAWHAGILQAPQLFTAGSGQDSPHTVTYKHKKETRDFPEVAHKSWGQD